MKPFTLSSADHFCHFCFKEKTDKDAVPQGFIVMDDHSLAQCFATLVEGHDVWVWCESGFRRIVTYLHSHYRYVKAAGGLVHSDDGRRLMIFREGRWDLPKGMVEPGETLAQAALREVWEETGVENLTLGPLLLKTYHIYDKYGGWHLKQTSWYAMSAPSSPSTVPQQEEGITQAVWTSPEECEERLQYSFASLRLLCQAIINQKSQSIESI